MFIRIAIVGQELSEDAGSEGTSGSRVSGRRAACLRHGRRRRYRVPSSLAKPGRGLVVHGDGPVRRPAAPPSPGSVRVPARRCSRAVPGVDADRPAACNRPSVATGTSGRVPRRPISCRTFRQLSARQARRNRSSAVSSSAPDANACRSAAGTGMAERNVVTPRNFSSSRSAAAARDRQISTSAST